MSKSGEAVAVLPSRRARKKARTRGEIYDAAMRLFVARGFDAVTVDDICDAADVARATFFLHFRTKDALLAEYGAVVTAELTKLLEEEHGSASATLRRAFEFLVARADRNAEIVRLMVREVMLRPAALADATVQSRGLVELLAGIVRRGQRKGELRAGVDPTLAAAIVVSAYMAIVGEWARRGGGLHLEPAVTQALEIVLGGLRRRRP